MLHRLRDAHRIPLRDLADIIRVGVGEIQRFESGDRLPPKRDVILKLAKRLQVEPVDLLAAAAEDLGAVEVEWLTPAQVREVVVFAERLRAGKSAQAPGGAS
jgi:transcriptional regulator with XRE-family HTH domain